MAGIDDEGVSFLKQQIIDQHARQKGFSIAVPVGADDVDRWLVGQSLAVSV
jgi:hypothetical protein